MVSIADSQSGNGGGNDVNHSRHHKRVVEQILAYHRGARAIEVDRGDVRRIVRDEEVSIYRRHHAEQYPSLDTQRVGERKHSHHLAS